MTLDCNGAKKGYFILFCFIKCIQIYMWSTQQVPYLERFYSNKEQWNAMYVWPRNTVPRICYTQSTRRWRSAAWDKAKQDGSDVKFLSPCVRMMTEIQVKLRPPESRDLWQWDIVNPWWTLEGPRYKYCLLYTSRCV